MAELKAPKYDGDADDIAREHGMEALGEMLDEAVTIPPKTDKLGRHESADTFVPKGKSIQVATEEEWRELNGEYADDAESEEPSSENSEYATPEEMGFGVHSAKLKAEWAAKLKEVATGALNEPPKGIWVKGIYVTPEMVGYELLPGGAAETADQVGQVQADPLGEH